MKSILKKSNTTGRGQDVFLKNGDMGRVRRIHVLIEQFEIMTIHGYLRRYSVNQYDPKSVLPENYQFPEQFDQIVDESNSVIGLTELEALKAYQFAQDTEESDGASSVMQDEDQDVVIPEEELNNLDDDPLLKN
ncbi:MAG: hypothetical protein U0T83_03510 [Bacteriovoracaceae bacterium]